MAICDSEDEFEPSIEVAVVVVVTAESWLLTVRSFSYFLLFFDALLRFLFVLFRVWLSDKVLLLLFVLRVQPPVGDDDEEEVVDEEDVDEADDDAENVRSCFWLFIGFTKWKRFGFGKCGGGTFLIFEEKI